MRLVALLILVTLLEGCTLPRTAVDPDSDAPEPGSSSPEPAFRPRSYAQALTTWRTAEDVNTWIGASFKYDLDRAVALSESQRRAKPGPQIVEPEVFFAEPTGVCVDLSRFAVETMKHVAPQLRPRYLMIEFNPAAVRGQILRRHWVVVYEDTDGVRVFADSKRPGVIAGPYHSLNEFIVEYAKFRGREILSYRELESYKRKAKVQSKRLKGDA